MSDNQFISRAIEAAGGHVAVSRRVGKTYQAVKKWMLANRLPYTEWVEITTYSQVIEEMIIELRGAEYVAVHGFTAQSLRDCGVKERAA